MNNRCADLLAATIAGKGWARKESVIEGALIDGLMINAFDMDDEAKTGARSKVCQRNMTLRMISLACASVKSP